MRFGPGGYSEDEDLAAAARARLDDTAAAAEQLAGAQRAILAELVGLWPTSAWVAAGCRTAKQWLRAYTVVSNYEAMRYEQTAELCHHHPELAEAVLSGAMPVKRAWMLAKAVTAERFRFLGAALPALLDLNARTGDDEAFLAGVRYWVDRVDERVEPARVLPHSLTMKPSLFGGGEAHAQLTPSAFAAFCAAIDAYTQDPDPTDAPYQRPLSERRADALDDMCGAALAGMFDHDPDNDDLLADEDDLIEDPGAGEPGEEPAAEGPTGQPEPEDDEEFFEEVRARDTWDGTAETDELDEWMRATEAGEDITDLDALRRRIVAMEKCRRRRMRRRTRMRSGATINAVVDIRTLLGLRDRDDLEEWDLQDLVLRGDGWALSRSVLERLLCDSGLLATIFDGQRSVLDANARKEQWTRGQRRAIAARDGCCVFPGCSRPARHCDIHHLHERNQGGPTVTGNGALLCRFHHRLVHDHRWRLYVRNDHWVAVDPHGHTWTGRPAPPTATAAA